MGLPSLSATSAHTGDVPQLSQTQVYVLARGAGLTPVAAVTATAVAQAESGLRSDAIGDTALEDGTWGPSVGLWQIRSQKAQYGTGQPRDASRLADPAFNAWAMAQISGAGKSFKPWTTYTKGAYKQYMSQDQQVARSAGDDPSSNNAGGVGGKLQSLLDGITSFMPGGALINQLGGNQVDAQVGTDVNTTLDKLNPFAGWQGFVLKALGGAAAASLVVLGAVHTVSSN